MLISLGFYTSSLFLTSLACLVLGFFVFFKGKDKLSNVTLGLLSLSLSLWCFAQFMGEIGESKEIVLFWTRESIAGAIFIPIFFLHFVLSLIDRAGQERKLLYFIYGLGILFLVADFTPLFVADVGPAPGFRYYPQAGVAYPFFALFILVCFGYGFLRLFTSFRKASGAKRNQLLYVILACIIGFLGGITAFFPMWNVNFPVLSHLALPIYVLITVYAILKHRLLDISVIVREGLVYSTLTLLFAGFYVLAVLFTNYFLSQFVHFSPVVTVFIVVFASVLVFQPLRDRVQRIVDRFFFQGEYQYLKTINDLSLENQKLFRSLLKADRLAALGTISAGMAHEIKNPLASIKGMTQVLEENLRDPAFIERYQKVVGRQIDRMNDLVEKLLKFGQPQKLSMGEVDLLHVVEDVLALLENQCQKKKIEINKRLIGLPKIKGDAELLSQVFLNLFLNAIQAMPDGGELSVGSKVCNNNSVYLEVCDTGQGIPEEKLDNIFDPFFTTKEEGSGMGLAVAYRIIKEHNGEITVESQPGKGTRFFIWLPIRPELSA